MPLPDLSFPRVWIADRSSEAVADEIPALLVMLLDDGDPERVCLLQEALRRPLRGAE